MCIKVGAHGKDSEVVSVYNIIVYDIDICDHVPQTTCKVIKYNF